MAEKGIEMTEMLPKTSFSNEPIARTGAEIARLLNKQHLLDRKQLVPDSFTAPVITTILIYSFAPTVLFRRGNGDRLQLLNRELRLRTHHAPGKSL